MIFKVLCADCEKPIAYTRIKHHRNAAHKPVDAVAPNHCGTCDSLRHLQVLHMAEHGREAKKK